MRPSMSSARSSTGRASSCGLPDERPAASLVGGTSMATVIGLAPPGRPMPAATSAREGLQGRARAAGRLRLARGAQLRRQGVRAPGPWAATACGSIPVDAEHRHGHAARLQSRRSRPIAPPGCSHSAWSGPPVPSTPVRSTSWPRSPTSCRERAALVPRRRGVRWRSPCSCPDLAPRLAGIERADSLAFDFHKWLHVPYDAGCVLVRDEAAASSGVRAAAGLSGRGRARPRRRQSLVLRLRRRLSAAAFARSRSGSRCRPSASTGSARRSPRNCAPGALAGARASRPSRNSSCWRRSRSTSPASAIAPRRPAELDRLNAAIVVELQERGIAAPSTTQIGGHLAIRVCLCNHRTEERDLAALVEGVLDLGSSGDPSPSTLRATGRATARMWRSPMRQCYRPARARSVGRSRQPAVAGSRSQADSADPEAVVAAVRADR